MCCEGKPLVSVIMGVRYLWHDTGLLERSVRSILDQTYSNLEFLICNGGSTAEAVSFLKRASDDDSRVKIISGQECPLQTEKLNLCLKASEGSYIARMDADDRAYPDRLEKQMRFLKENDDISFVGCNVRLVKDGAPVGERRLPLRPQVRDFYMTQPYIHPALLFRREALEAVGGYSEDPDCAGCEDYDLLLRMHGLGLDGANLQEILLDYTFSYGGNRDMHQRLNEVKTRYRRFKDLGLLPQALPYVAKPVAVGLLPKSVLFMIKERRFMGSNVRRCRPEDAPPAERGQDPV